MSTRKCAIGVSMLAFGLAHADLVSAQMAPEPFLPVRDALVVGERMEYSIKLGPARLGRAELAVESRDDVAGELAYRVAVDVEMGASILKVEERLVSWIAPRPFRSLAFERRDPDTKDQRQRLDFDRNVLDELATLYFVRTLPLTPDFNYEADRYFSPDGNPMTFRVVGHEKVRVPAGRFETIVVESVIPALSIFRSDAQARIYLSDDDRRVLVKVETRSKAGPLTIYLTKYQAER